MSTINEKRRSFRLRFGADATSTATSPPIASSPPHSLSPASIFSLSNQSLNSVSSSESDSQSLDILSQFPSVSFGSSVPLSPSPTKNRHSGVADSFLKPPPPPVPPRSRARPRSVGLSRKSESMSDFVDLFTRREHTRVTSFLSMSSDNGSITAPESTSLNDQEKHDTLSILCTSTGFSEGTSRRSKKPPKRLRFQGEPTTSVTFEYPPVPSLTVEPPSPPPLFDLPSIIPLSTPSRKTAPVVRLWRTLASVGRKGRS